MTCGHHFVSNTLPLASGAESSMPRSADRWNCSEPLRCDLHSRRRADCNRLLAVQVADRGAEVVGHPDHVLHTEQRLATGDVGSCIAAAMAATDAAGVASGPPPESAL